MSDLNSIKARLGSISDTTKRHLPKAVLKILEEDMPRLVTMNKAEMLEDQYGGYRRGYVAGYKTAINDVCKFGQDLCRKFLDSKLKKWVDAPARVFYAPRIHKVMTIEKSEITDTPKQQTHD